MTDYDATFRDAVLTLKLDGAATSTDFSAVIVEGSVTTKTDVDTVEALNGTRDASAKTPEETLSIKFIDFSGSEIEATGKHDLFMYLRTNFRKRATFTLQNRNGEGRTATGKVLIIPAKEFGGKPGERSIGEVELTVVDGLVQFSYPEES